MGYHSSGNRLWTRIKNEIYELDLETKIIKINDKEYCLNNENIDKMYFVYDVFYTKNFEPFLQEMLVLVANETQVDWHTLNTKYKVAYDKLLERVERLAITYIQEKYEKHIGMPLICQCASANNDDVANKLVTLGEVYDGVSRLIEKRRYMEIPNYIATHKLFSNDED